MGIFRVVPNFLIKIIRCHNHTNGDLSRIRNIGISAHIDSGKTTVTERILFYTGKVNTMHEVKGRDGVGAVMDFMELERLRGITIQSAATYAQWNKHVINIIDTPGHVDFTVEVERALRVLDGAILVLCAVGGVQSQTLTVNRQMDRYDVPRIAFINKLDRTGANPERVLTQIRTKLRHNSAFIQLPLMLEADNEGIVDIIKEKALFFDEPYGLTIREGPVPEYLLLDVKKRRKELIECIANVDDEVGEAFLSEGTVTNDLLVKGIRRATLALKFVPVLMGSALKNRGIQTLLDAVVDYLPNPSETRNVALLETKDKTEKIPLNPERSSNYPFLGLAFKLELGKQGQLTFIRCYQGKVSKGDQLVNVRTGKRIKVSRLVRMNAQNMDDLNEAYAGDICALFGIECSSGDTFMMATATTLLSMETMFIPDPVVSMSITLTNNKHAENFMKALRRFLKEDPTFKMTYDEESKQTIIHGMGELHLEIYAQRIAREYNAPVTLGKPKVAFRETLSEPVEYNYLHKKQSGGAGQYGRVIGIVKPMTGDDFTKIEFVDETTGMKVSKSYIPSVEKGFRSAADNGPLAGQRISGIKIIMHDGDSHCVDSSDWSFQCAGAGAMKDVKYYGNWKIIEPVMTVEVDCPIEYNREIITSINQRNGVIEGSEEHDGFITTYAKVPLNEMFGYSSHIRSKSEGKAEYAMEYSHYQYAPDKTVNALVQEFQSEEEERYKKLKK